MFIKEILAKVVELDGTFRKINIYRNLGQVATKFETKFEQVTKANEFYKWVGPHCTSVERDLSPYQIIFLFTEKGVGPDRSDIA